MQHLSPYAAQALATLQRLLPDLAALAVEQDEGFLISTKSPSGFECWMMADEGEVTVGFAEHHTHFGWYQGDSQEDTADAVKYVQELRAGQLVVVAWYEGKKFVGSATQEVGQPAPDPTWLHRKQEQVTRRWTG